ncbi:MAG: pyruvoyl-dependent arginine decarboxylase [Chloroflexi bacterium]|nr:pyruvoyl-dependent arginine decarboxylase [Chloroflexota bacterium]
MKIHLTVGKGEGPTPLAAFDAALRDAGVANYNLLCLSSVIPPGSVIVREKYEPPSDEYGHRLYVVMARAQATTPGESAWAGLGWTQDPRDGRGLFVELEGPTRENVEARIQATLEAMIAARPHAYGPIQAEIVGVECRWQPVCAIVVATYASQGWGI